MKLCFLCKYFYETNNIFITHSRAKIFGTMRCPCLRSFHNGGLIDAFPSVNVMCLAICNEFPCLYSSCMDSFDNWQP